MTMPGFLLLVAALAGNSDAAPPQSVGGAALVDVQSAKPDPTAAAAATDPKPKPSPNAGAAQDGGETISDANAKKIAGAVKETLSGNKTVKMGLSLGWRLLPKRSERQFRDVSLAADGHILLDEGDASSVVLSGVVTAYPFRDLDKGPKKLGFVANINLADFSADNVGVFNKTIEGGIGLAWRLNDDFAIAFTAERAFSRSLRKGVDLSKPVLGTDGKPAISIDRTDPRYFHEDNVTAISLKWVYLF